MIRWVVGWQMSSDEYLSLRRGKRSNHNQSYIIFQRNLDAHSFHVSRPSFYLVSCIFPGSLKLAINYS